MCLYRPTPSLSGPTARDDDLAGTGADRIFNPVLQSQRFDSDGRFIQRCLPQLGELEATFVHTLWRLGALTMSADHPTPIAEQRVAPQKTLVRFSKLAPLLPVQTHGREAAAQLDQHGQDHGQCASSAFTTGRLKPPALLPPVQRSPKPAPPPPPPRHEIPAQCAGSRVRLRRTRLARRGQRSCRAGRASRPSNRHA